MLINIPLYLYISFCSIIEILVLRTTCKLLYQEIPKEWMIRDLFVVESDEQVEHLDNFTTCCSSKSFEKIIRTHKYIENIFIHKSTSNQIYINFPLYHLQEITITSEYELEYIKCQNYVPNIKRLTIINAPNLKQLELPSCSQLETIHIVCTRLEQLVIPPSWTRLKNVLLSGIGTIHTIIFPVRCNGLQQINISNTAIRTIKILGILWNILFIDGYHPTRIRIYTPLVNKSQIRIKENALIDWIYI